MRKLKLSLFSCVSVQSYKNSTKKQLTLFYTFFKFISFNTFGIRLPYNLFIYTLYTRIELKYGSKKFFFCIKPVDIFIREY